MLQAEKDRIRARLSREQSYPLSTPDPGNPAPKPKRKYASKHKPNGRTRAWAKGLPLSGTPNGFKRGDRKIDDEQLLKALQATRGLKTRAAAALGISPATIFKYIRERPHLRERLHELEEAALDEAEEQLGLAISKGDIRAVTFFLAMKGSSRGYIRKSELSGPDGAPLQAPIARSDLIAALEEVLAKRQKRLGSEPPASPALIEGTVERTEPGRAAAGPSPIPDSPEDAERS